ncbi:STAS-like domain-containing protein [Marinovum algicola]|uniref:STAS-like domain-containing protein n=1 Tax=Marinovum algicola TaxID=42444 RepID=UPI003B51B7E8
MNVIRIADDFNEFPGGRYPEDGDGNGTDFRERFLEPALSRGERVKIDLDGTRGYPSSFLEEAFGGLIRKGVSREKIKATFEFVATQPGFSRFIDLIDEHLKRADKAAKASLAG